jgi:hypothetical protein
MGLISEATSSCDLGQGNGFVAVLDVLDRLADSFPQNKLMRRESEARSE